MGKEVRYTSDFMLSGCNARRLVSVCSVVSLYLLLVIVQSTADWGQLIQALGPVVIEH